MNEKAKAIQEAAYYAEKKKRERLAAEQQSGARRTLEKALLDRILAEAEAEEYFNLTIKLF